MLSHVGSNSSARPSVSTCSPLYATKSKPIHRSMSSSQHHVQENMYLVSGTLFPLSPSLFVHPYHHVVNTNQVQVYKLPGTIMSKAAAAAAGSSVLTYSSLPVTNKTLLLIDNIIPGIKHPRKELRCRVSRNPGGYTSYMNVIQQYTRPKWWLSQDFLSMSFLYEL